MAANPMGKARPVDRPYLIFTNDQGWEWRVLKAWQADNSKQFARWFCSVRSPFTMGGSDMGDTYVEDVVNHGTETFRDPELEGVDLRIPARGQVTAARDFFAEL